MTMSNANETGRTEKLSARERIQRFRKLAREQNQNSMMQHPVTQAICEGRASRELLKALVLNLYTFALESNAAAVGIKQWNRRQMLLRAPEINFVVVTEKVIDELTNPGPSGHMRMLEILWKTLGGAREELLLSSPSTEVRIYSDHHVRSTLDEGRSSFDEEQFGHWSALIYQALVKHYGFTPEQAIYFKEHGEADTSEHRDGITSHGEMENLAVIRRFEEEPSLKDEEIERNIKRKFLLNRMLLDGVARDEKRVLDLAPRRHPSDPAERVAALTAAISEKFQNEIFKSEFMQLIERGALSAEKTEAFVKSLYYFIKMVGYSTGLMYHYKKSLLRSVPDLQDITTGIIAGVTECWLPNSTPGRRPIEKLLEKLSIDPSKLSDQPPLVLARALVDYRVRIISEASLPEALALWINEEDLANWFVRIGDALTRHYGVDSEAASWFFGHGEPYRRVLNVTIGEMARRGLGLALEQRIPDSTPGWGLEYAAETQVSILELFLASAVRSNGSA
jgi:pyrroloquinoline quinone (PQQ) biosynthesis protein C